MLCLLCITQQRQATQLVRQQKHCVTEYTEISKIIRVLVVFSEACKQNMATTLCSHLFSLLLCCTVTHRLTADRHAAHYNTQVYVTSRCVSSFRRFERWNCLHLQRQKNLLFELLDPEVKGTTALRNVGNYSPNDTASHATRHVSWATPLWEC